MQASFAPANRIINVVRKNSELMVLATEVAIGLSVLIYNPSTST